MYGIPHFFHQARVLYQMPKSYRVLHSCSLDCTLLLTEPLPQFGGSLPPSVLLFMFLLPDVAITSG